MKFLKKIKNFLQRLKTEEATAVVDATTLLEVKHIRKGKVLSEQTVKDRVVTTAFVEDLVAALRGQSGPYESFNSYKWHASGTDSTSEEVGDTSLHAEVEDRVEGSQQTGETDNIYKSVATIQYTSANVIEEHGLFNSYEGGTLMDRTVFSGVPVKEDDSIQFTFTIQFNAGG